MAEHEVSLFTREWIEILRRLMRGLQSVMVSLFTREWIEIFVSKATIHGFSRLPLYEGVD